MDKRNTTSFVARALRGFVKLNIAISDRIERFLPKAFRVNLLEQHKQSVLSEIASRKGPRVLDVGGGKNSPFLQAMQTGRSDVTVFGVDISAEELERNSLLDGKVVCDAASVLPITSQSIDVIVTRSVIEHLHDTENFLRESYRVMKPGGVCLHVLPCRYSPFSMLNQLLPDAVTRRILYAFFPNWQSACGFKAYYHNCYQPRLSNLIREIGFEIEEQSVRYYQSIYFRFFVPFYLISLLYDLLVWTLGLERLACQTLLVAKRPDSNLQETASQS